MIDQAVEVISRGGVVIAPEKMGYVFIADAFHTGAAQVIRLAKGMIPGETLQVVVADERTLHGLARDLSDEANALMNKFWPGPLSLVVKSQSGLNWDVGDGGSQGVFLARCSEAEVIRDIARKHGPILTATVALVGGSIARTLAELEPFRSHADLVIEAQGEFDANVLSTIVDVSGNPPTILRRGALSLLELASQAPSIRVAS